LGVLSIVAISSAQARADVTYAYASASKGDSASVTFTSVYDSATNKYDEIEMTVTNTEPFTNDAGNAISGVSFTLGGSDKIGSFLQLSGNTNDLTSPGSGSGFQSITLAASNAGLAGHWQFTSSGGSTSAILNALSGTQPNHLIVSYSDTASSPNGSLDGNHQPSFVGSASFLFSSSVVPSSLTNSDITGVTFQFGTTPENPNAPGTYVPNQFQQVPEPSGIVALLGLSGMGLVGLVRRARSRRVATM
jgi:hypothetical protein